MNSLVAGISAVLLLSRSKALRSTSNRSVGYSAVGKFHLMIQCRHIFERYCRNIDTVTIRGVCLPL